MSFMSWRRRRYERSKARYNDDVIYDNDDNHVTTRTRRLSCRIKNEIYRNQTARCVYDFLFLLPTFFVAIRGHRSIGFFAFLRNFGMFGI